jgi:dynein heavy chain
MSKFFKGLAANGTWVCFDEFNRLEIHVLSIISQLIVALSNAKHDNASSIVIEETTLPFNQHCGLFITMNPFHFGRTPLPDNLKSLFRQITMVVPDTLFIAEILLYSVGFNSARNLAFKITRTFALINEQLKYEQHYDFGLRTIKSVLVYAGIIKLRVMNVKNRLNINQETAENRLSDHLNGIKRMTVN